MSNKNSKLPPSQTSPSKKKCQKIIIEGITEEGQTFRPTNWGERMCEQLSTFQKHQIVYSPKLQPSIRKGTKCILIDPSLKESNPLMYSAVLQFACDNHLKVSQEEDEEE